jgi:hypothetical protein
MVQDNDRPIGLRISERQLAAIDRLAEESDVSRSKMIRLLLGEALGAAGEPRRSAAVQRAAIDQLKPLIDAGRAIEAAYGQELGTLAPQLIRISRALPRLAEQSRTAPPGTVVVDKSAWREREERIRKLERLMESREEDQ